MFTPAQVNVLAITAEHAQDERLPRLPCVEEEVQAMVESAARAGASVSSDTSATTKGELLAMLKSASVVHFACHGRQCDTEPHESHFCLSTGDLTVAQLMEVDLKHGFFAFLSACETAKGDLKHADEAIHLAAAMLFVGFKSVVASMW
jgi:CHAT domain-containing protein